MVTRSARCTELLFGARRHLWWWSCVAEFRVLMNPRDGCVFGAASLARGIFVFLLDASLESEVPPLFSSMLRTSRREAEMKKKKKGCWAQVNINVVVIESRDNGWQNTFLQVINGLPTCSTLFPFRAPSSHSSFLYDLFSPFAFRYCSWKSQDPS